MQTFYIIYINRAYDHWSDDQQFYMQNNFYIYQKILNILKFYNRYFAVKITG